MNVNAVFTKVTLIIEGFVNANRFILYV